MFHFKKALYVIVLIAWASFVESLPTKDDRILVRGRQLGKANKQQAKQAPKSQPKSTPSTPAPSPKASIKGQHKSRPETAPAGGRSTPPKKSDKKKRSTKGQQMRNRSQYHQPGNGTFANGTLPCPQNRSWTPIEAGAAGNDTLPDPAAQVRSTVVCNNLDTCTGCVTDKCTWMGGRCVDQCEAGGTCFSMQVYPEWTIRHICDKCSQERHAMAAMQCSALL